MFSPNKAELSRAHTLRTCCILHVSCIDLHSCLLEYVSMLTIFTDIVLWTCAHEQITHGLPLIGMANKTLYCDTRGPCQSIQSIVKPVYRRFRQIRRTYESLRCLDVMIWWFSWRQQTDRQQTDKTKCFTPCTCVRGNEHALEETRKWEGRGPVRNNDVYL